MAVDELSKKNPDGTRFGQSAADLIAFCGATPVAQQTAGTSNTIVITNTSATSLLASAIQQLQTSNNALVNALLNPQHMENALHLHGNIGKQDDPIKFPAVEHPSLHVMCKAQGW